MTDARFGPGLREVLTTPEHSMMMDTIEENLAKWIARFDYYKEQNEQAVIEAAEQGGQTARVLVALKATQIARPSRSQLELAVVEYVAWFNNERLHEALGDRPPREVEELYAAKDRPTTPIR